MNFHVTAVSALLGFVVLYCFLMRVVGNFKKKRFVSKNPRSFSRASDSLNRFDVGFYSDLDSSDFCDGSNDSCGSDFGCSDSASDSADSGGDSGCSGND